MRTILTLAALTAFVALAGCDNPPPAKPTVAKPAPTTVNKPVQTDKATDANLDADNTGVNKRDRDPAAKTPIDQNENQADVNMTAEIRKRMLAAEGMSINGRNAKVITADGKVTLRGPVDSNAERDTIATIAEEVAGGKDKVVNELEVAKK
jgi:hyperosmotically inducible periplasmic protein